MWKRWKRGFRPIPAGQIPTGPVLVCLVFIVAGLFENRGKRISRGPFVAKREKCGNFPHTFHREKTESFPPRPAANSKRCRKKGFPHKGTIPVFQTRKILPGAGQSDPFWQLSTENRPDFISFPQRIPQHVEKLVGTRGERRPFFREGSAPPKNFKKTRSD